MILEIVVYSIEGALKAQEGGADRLELCANPAEGGTTPSPGVVDVIRQNITCDLYTMIRPRGGDFCYSRFEFHAMKRDIGQFQRLSVDGFVFGILTPQGRIDVERCRELIQKSRPLKVTCHRAFDMTRDPFEALEDCIEAGFHRILTSGHHSTAYEGREIIAQLIEKAGGRIIIMPGSGVNEQTVQQIANETGATEFHFSATQLRPSIMEYRNETIASMGNSSDSEYQVRTVNPETIQRIRGLLGR
jgi:copper homeostasis protein